MDGSSVPHTVDVTLSPVSFGITKYASGHPARRTSDDPTHRGYFVEKVTLELEPYNPGLVNYQTTDTTNGILQAQISVAQDQRTSGSASVVVGRDPSLGVTVGKEAGNQQTQQVQSQLVDWTITNTDHACWEISRNTWNVLDGNQAGAKLYPALEVRNKIPKVSNACKQHIFASWQMVDSDNDPMRFPSMGALFRSDGEKEARESLSKVSVNVTMGLRKLKTRKRSDGWASPFQNNVKEMHHSYREVRIKGDLHLCRFPENILMMGCCGWVFSVVIIPVFAVIYFVISAVIQYG